jgi:hypothetical protein
MRLFLANLLLKYTKCYAYTQGTSVSLVWKSNLDTFSWSLHASRDKRVIISRNNKLIQVKHHPKHHKHYD